MAEITTIARPYAEAVAALAREAGSWAAWSRDLALLVSVVENEQVADLVANPAISSEQVADIIKGVCAGALSADAGNLVSVLAENKRYAALPEIARLFEEAKTAQEGMLEAKVTTAFELTAEQLAGLVVKLEAKLGKKVNASQVLDPDLIGGVVIQVGDEVLDASVRGRMNAMAATLIG